MNPCFQRYQNNANQNGQNNQNNSPFGNVNLFQQAGERLMTQMFPAGTTPRAGVEQLVQSGQMTQQQFQQLSQQADQIYQMMFGRKH